MSRPFCPDPIRIILSCQQFSECGLLTVSVEDSEDLYGYDPSDVCAATEAVSAAADIPYKFINGRTNRNRRGDQQLSSTCAPNAVLLSGLFLNSRLVIFIRVRH